MHVVDPIAYDVIALYPHHTPEEIVSAVLSKYEAGGYAPAGSDEPLTAGDELLTAGDILACIGDVKTLKEQGQLFSPDTFAEIAGTFKERSGDVVKALCLHVAHTCNLNCSYCFASQGKYHGERALMSFETGR